MSDRDQWPPRVLKVCGADVELGNFFLGGALTADSPGAAARALLARIDGVLAQPAGVPACSCAICVGRRQSIVPAPGIVSPINPQDQGRRFLLENGGAAYIDLDHLELCQPEVTSAFDHVACWHAMLRLARQALVSANSALDRGRTLQVLVNNRDGRGNSYGGHLDFLITRRAWDNIFCRRMHHLLYLAAYQVSSIVFTGQGKVGAENGRPDAAFQLSQRADFIETLTGPQTTFARPIVNSRDEPLCGKADGLARLHAIFFDSTLCHVASLLKVGVMQIVLAMIEAEQVNPDLVLDDPLDALGVWSRDTALVARAPLASGLDVTAVELQRRFFEEASTFAASGELDAVVPRAAEILALWDDTLRKLEARDFAALAPRLDWVLKRSLLDRVQRRHPDLGWDAAPIRHLDHVYSSLDEHDGLYWACEASDAVERVVSDADIRRFMVEPPEDTRAWTRAMLLRVFGKEGVAQVDWDSMRVAVQESPSRLTVRQIDMPHPVRLGRGEAEQCFEAAATSGDAGALLDALGIVQETETTGAMS